MTPVERFFHPVLHARKLKRRPVRVEVAGRAYVLFRDRTGRPGGLVDACPHRFAPLSAGRVRPDGRLQCPYHGWHFDTQGRGAAPSAPGLKGCDATALQVVERHDYLWIAHRDVPLSAFPEASWDGYEQARAFSILFRAPLHVALDNFSETEHTPWVHTRLGWSEDDAHKVVFETRTFPDRSEVGYRAPQRATAFRMLIGSRPGDLFCHRYTCRFDPVRAEYNLSWMDPRSHRSRGVLARILIFLVPETDRTTRFHVFVHLAFQSTAMRLLAPLIKRIGSALAYMEIREDAKFIPVVADTPIEVKGMRLSKFDKPVVHNRKLLKELYWGDHSASELDAAGR